MNEGSEVADRRGRCVGLVMNILLETFMVPSLGHSARLLSLLGLSLITMACPIFVSCFGQYL